MTPEQAELLANHAASTWPDILPGIWAARLVSYDFAEARAALSRLRALSRTATLEHVDQEITRARTAKAQPCLVCAGTGWVTRQEPSRVVFATDTTEHPVTVIPEPDVDPAADRAEVARAWIAAIRTAREQAHVETRTRMVTVTAPCPECRAITPKENP